MKYDVFISYSRLDIAVADRICAAFDKAGISYFIDRQGIGGGLEFPAVIASAIKESDVFLFLASANSYRSKFTNSEITYAFNKKEKNHLLPYVIDGSSLPDALEFVFSCINVRNIKDHPVETTLVKDVMNLLGRQIKVSVSRPVTRPVSKPVSSSMSESVKQGAAILAAIDSMFAIDNGSKWKIGDFYNVGVKKGIVFWVDSTGRHGKIVSLDQVATKWNSGRGTVNTTFIFDHSTKDEKDGMKNQKVVMSENDWQRKYPAFAWCADHGEGWYLPAIDELKELFLNDSVFSIVNEVLEKCGEKMAVRGEASMPYWSSTGYGYINAMVVNMYNATIYHSNCNTLNYVRAVCAF
ncbi:MAG: TIR domain-containing protein [Bacteroidales bacterium]|nr:TIR domain-containing protein [Bacteroidales bacterium]